ncbi:MAG: FeoB-associated Cys-rich membrane protein [Bacillota bacterium]|nr:FeoB-associated Cys-rich membrane protein [Bacillota bacterium]
MEILSTVLVLLVLTGIVGLIVRSMIKAKRAGRSVICGGSCGGCGGACGCHLQKEQQEDSVTREI